MYETMVCNLIFKFYEDDRVDLSWEFNQIRCV